MAARNVGSAPLSALCEMNRPNSALPTRITAGELRTSSVLDTPGWAASAIVDAPAAAKRRCSSYVNIRFASFDCPYAATRLYERSDWRSSKLIRARMLCPMLLTVTTRESVVVSKPVEQEAGEREVAEVVGTELELEPVRGRAPRRVHQAGVVDQQVDPVVVAEQFVGGRPYRAQRGQVQLLNADVGGGMHRHDPGGGVLALVDTADGEHHGCAVAGQLHRGVESESGVRAGDDSGSSGLIRHVVGRPRGRGGGGGHRSSPLGAGYDSGRAFRLDTIRNVRPVCPPAIGDRMTTPRKPQRADAARNRARILEVAYEAFAADGVTVPIDEIARRAGVGAGTVYRHFPTKESLFQAIATDRVERLVQHAYALAAERGPGDALFSFLATMVNEGATDQGLVDTMAGIGFDLADVAPDAEQRFLTVLGDLLARAQGAGEVRGDIGVGDIKALLVGCQAMQRYSGDADVTDRVLAVVRDGLTVSRDGVVPARRR